MVEEKVIEFILQKCWTKAQIREKLSHLSQDEKNTRLEGLLNQGEKEWYQKVLFKKDLAETLLKQIEKRRSEGSYLSDDKRDMKRESDKIEEMEKEAFKFERRIFEKFNREPKHSIEVNVSDYTLEEQTDYIRDNTVGDLERRQIESQSNLKLSWSDVGYLKYYFDGARELNSRLYNGKSWNNLSDSEKEAKNKRFNNIERNLSKIINNTDGLVEDMQVFHGGIFDVTKMVGDKVKFKGYVSTSFQMNVANEFKKYSPSIPDELYYTYRILLKKGEKGFCANDKRYGDLTQLHYEQELLLDKGVEGDIVDIDYNNHIVTLIKSN